MEFAISQPKLVRLPRNEKQNMSIEIYDSHAIIGFDFGKNPGLGFSRSNFEIAVSLEREGRLTFNKRDVSQSFVIMTFWRTK